MLLTANGYLHTCDEYPEWASLELQKRLKVAFEQNTLQNLLNTKYATYRCDLPCKEASLLSTHGHVWHIVTGSISD